MPDEVQIRMAQLTAGNADQQATAAEALARLGEGAQPAAVALVQACGSTDERIRQWSTAALEELGPPPPLQIPRLVELAHDAQVDVAYWAITLLGRAGDDAAPAVATLANVLGSGAAVSVRERAAWALGKLGPTAQAAAPALRAAAAASDEPRLSRLAQSALDAVAQ